MKQQEYNEIDTLLRGLARRRGAADNLSGKALVGEKAVSSAHLDGDELSSYAERVLPPAAQARYTAHLADCADCRKIVAQLSLAAGPLADEQRVEQKPIPGLTWAQGLSALLSPRIIRYAMPALAILLFGVVFLLWYQQSKRSAGQADAVALNEKAQPATAVRPGGEPSPTQVKPEENRSKNGAIAGEVEGDNNKAKDARPQPTSVPATPAGGAKAGGESSDEKEKKAGGEGSSSTAASKAAKQDAPAADKVAADQPAYAPEPPSAGQTQSAVNQEQQQKDLAKNNVAEERERGRDVAVQRKGPARNENNEVSQRGPAKSEAKPAPKLRVAAAAGAAGARADDDETDTRAVSGRRFRRLNNAWVDTAYKSSMSIRSVTRDTEAYRALIADEPAIGNIANQLGGEVIVVWKGHAYRIN